MAQKDTKTRFQNVFARHRGGKIPCLVQTTASGLPRSGTCDCEPRYYGVVWDRRLRKHTKTPMFGSATAANNARGDLADQLERGEIPQSTTLKVAAAVERFLAATEEGRALNKWGRRYKPSALYDLKGCLNNHLVPRFGKRRMADVRRRDIQELVDELTPTLSGSRVRSVVNAIRSLYHWAEDRELVDHDPAARVRLPAMNATPRDRVATPAEFAGLLAALPLKNALPYALAAYGTARAQEIKHLDWEEVDFELSAMRLAQDARKSEASLRLVPLVRPLAGILKRAWLEQGRPNTGKVVPPRRDNTRGVVCISNIQNQARKRWKDAKLSPIGLHECRHTAATWLDHAGVSPKVASQLMGHQTPERQVGAAAITLSRYTHTLPGELERARDLLDRFLADRESTEREAQ